MVEIEEESSPNPNPKSVKTKVPEVEVHLYGRGKGPIDVFRSSLGGWDQDRLEVQDILDKYGFKSVYAFNSESGRGVPIRCNSRNGRSELPYRDGAVIYVDGEPKDPLVKPVTKILVAVAVLALVLAVFVKETPKWLDITRLAESKTFPPWVIAFIVIAFTRLRKRTVNLVKKFGW